MGGFRLGGGGVMPDYFTVERVYPIGHIRWSPDSGGLLRQVSLYCQS